MAMLAGPEGSELRALAWVMCLGHIDLDSLTLQRPQQLKSCRKDVIYMLFRFIYFFNHTPFYCILDEIRYISEF